MKVFLMNSIGQSRIDPMKSFLKQIWIIQITPKGVALMIT